MWDWPKGKSPPFGSWPRSRWAGYHQKKENLKEDLWTPKKKKEKDLFKENEKWSKENEKNELSESP